MMASMAVPFQVVMIPLISIYGGMFHMLNSRTVLVLMNFGFGTAMCIFMCHGFIKSNIPIALEEAAVMMPGLNPERVLQCLQQLEYEKSNGIVFNTVKDYTAQNVSDKVVRIILSYTDYVKRTVWKKYD